MTLEHCPQPELCLCVDNLRELTVMTPTPHPRARVGEEKAKIRPVYQGGDGVLGNEVTAHLNPQVKFSWLKGAVKQCGQARGASREDRMPRPRPSRTRQGARLSSHCALQDLHGHLLPRMSPGLLVHGSSRIYSVCCNYEVQGQSCGPTPKELNENQGTIPRDTFWEAE